MKQTTNTILMIEPVAFTYNAETALNNYFQQNTGNSQELAHDEFIAFVEKLSEQGIRVITIKDTPTPHTPDSIFPNNWISFHENGSVVLYPMFAKNRRPERREDILDIIEEKGFHIEEVIDYTDAENSEIFLEGTGSMVLDRVHKIAYACLSPRTDEDLLIEFCEDLEYTPVLFNAYQTVDNQRLPIYHTNVMMCVANRFVVICLDSIDDKKEKSQVVDFLKQTNKEIIAITEKQMHHFAGNMLQVEGTNGEVLVMSQTAYNSLTKEQIVAMEQYCPILYSDISTIEKNGGGSARCMMAEVFLPKNL